MRSGRVVFRPLAGTGLALSTALIVRPDSPSLAVDALLAGRITDAIVDAYKSPAETVHVWIDEYPADGYAVAGKLVADR
jgi:4-oxalocrotonate tautomerase